MVQTVNDELLHKTVDHSIDRERYGNGVVLRMIAILNKADKHLFAALTDALQRLPPESFTVQRLDALLKDVRALNVEVYKSLQKAAEGEIKSLVDYETKYQVDLFTHVLPVQVSVASVTPDVVYAAAMARPFQVSKNGAVPLNEYLQGLSDDRARKIRDAVRLGYISGETTDQIVKRIVGTKTQNYADGLMDAPRRFVEGMVRTALNHTSTVAAEQFYKANEELISGVMWVSTLDTSTCETCASLDGQVFPVDSGERSPAHINCIPADTLVSTCSRVSRIYKRTYKGALVEIVTKSGRNLVITPNHPILTRAGWKDAGAINSGDQVVCVSNGFDIGNHHKDNVIAEIGDLFASADVTVDPCFVTVRPTTAEDFHGDSANSKVNIIFINGLTWDAIRKTIQKNRKYKALVDRKIACFAFPGFSSINKFLLSCFSSFACNISITDKFKYFCGSAFIHPCLLLLRSVSCRAVFAGNDPHNNATAARETKCCWNPSSAYSRLVSVINFIKSAVTKLNGSCGRYIHPVKSEDSHDWLSSCADHLPYATSADAVNGIEFDDVIDVKLREDVFCHVYNLENEKNWYVANGIITHNCRCRTAPVVKSWKELGIDLPERDTGTRASMDGQVSAKLTYQKWLEKQSASRQDEVLGVTKGKLFRAGATVDKFVDNKGKTLTISQLRERNKQAFDNLGL